MAAVALASAVAAGTVSAAEEPKSPHTLTGNVGIFSQYIFRGLTQTDRDPAIQGGFDYSHASGLYAGTWASNISWLKDLGTFNESTGAVAPYRSGGSMEWDFYGGYKGTFGKSDFGYDVGLLYYWYPGDEADGFKKADTFEIYGALTWKWLSAKYSYSLMDKTFGVPDSSGTWYLDLSATVPITDKFNLIAHWGKQEYKGTTAGVSNDSFASYEDWKIGLSYSLPKDFTIGAFYSDTSMSDTQRLNYTTPASAGGRFLGKETFTVYLQKTF